MILALAGSSVGLSVCLLTSPVTAKFVVFAAYGRKMENLYTPEYGFQMHVKYHTHTLVSAACGSCTLVVLCTKPSNPATKNRTRMYPGHVMFSSSITNSLWTYWERVRPFDLSCRSFYRAMTLVRGARRKYMTRQNSANQDHHLRAHAELQNQLSHSPRW